MSDFLVTHRFDNVANAAVVQMLVRVNAARELIFGADLEGAGVWDVLMFEGPTLNAPGTQLGAMDMDRAAPATADSLFYHTPNVAALGAQLFDKTAGTVFISKLGNRDSGPLILRANLDYLIQATNRSGVAQDLGIQLSFTEIPTR